MQAPVQIVRVADVFALALYVADLVLELGNDDVCLTELRVQFFNFWLHMR